MLRLRPTFEQIEREARTSRLRILPERQRRTQQGILLEEVDFDDFDLSKYDRKMIMLNDNNPEKGTQTDVFNETESENMKTPEDSFKEQINEDEESNISSSKISEKSEERETEQEKGLLRRLYNSLFEEVDADIPVSNQPSLSSDTPIQSKKQSPIQSEASSSRRSSSSRNNLLPIAESSSAEEVTSVHDSNPLTVETSIDRTIEYVDETTPPQSVISSRRSQETIEYIRSRTSSKRSSIQSVSS